MIDQHMYSDGEITADGLSPRHYDESFEPPFAAPRARKIEFGDDEVHAGQRPARDQAAADAGRREPVRPVRLDVPQPAGVARAGHTSCSSRWRCPTTCGAGTTQVLGHEHLTLPFGRHRRGAPEAPARRPAAAERISFRHLDGARRCSTCPCRSLGAGSTSTRGRCWRSTTCRCRRPASDRCRRRQAQAFPPPPSVGER